MLAFGLTSIRRLAQSLCTTPLTMTQRCGNSRGGYGNSTYQLMLKGITYGESLSDIQSVSEWSNMHSCFPHIINTIFQYHLAIFFKPRSRACFTGIYLSSSWRVSHSNWSHSRRGTTLWQVEVICAESLPWVSARIYQYNLSMAELKKLYSFLSWGSLEQDLLFFIWRKTACN